MVEYCATFSGLSLAPREGYLSLCFFPRVRRETERRNDIPGRKLELLFSLSFPHCPASLDHFQLRAFRNYFDEYKGHRVRDGGTRKRQR